MNLEELQQLKQEQSKNQKPRTITKNIMNSTKEPDSERKMCFTQLITTNQIQWEIEMRLQAIEQNKLQLISQKIKEEKGMNKEANDQLFLYC